MIERYFPNTKYALNKTLHDFRAIYKTIKYTSLLFTVVYLAYMFIAKVGNFWVNVALAGVSLVYFIFFVFTGKMQSGAAKSTKKVVRRVYHWLKICVRAVSLGILLYGMAIAPESASPISIILATVTILIWMLQVVFELLCNLLEVHKDLIAASIIKDWEAEPVQQAKEKTMKTVAMVSSGIEKIKKTAKVVDKILHPFKSKKHLNEPDEAAAADYILIDDDEPSED